MVASRKFSEGKPQVPHTQRISDVVAVDTPVLAANTTLVLLPSFLAQHNPVILEATLQIDTGGSNIINVNVLRDGAELTAFYFQEDLPIDSPVVRTYHWFDPTPGQFVVYTLVANAPVAGPAVVAGSRFSIHI